ncbi:MAG TPA: phosphatidylserine decarboxylase family protein [Longimicrobiales bacterium]|nr:phosphatidylserine decarboxylase family protein [Longimicrobiales bacterium]
MRLAREGYPFVGAALFFAAIAWALAARAGSPAHLMAAVPLTALALFVLWFFRDPVRALPEAADLVIAPGEGRIIDIVEIEEPTFLRSTARRITIFLSVFDVHVQRAPVTGTVEHKSYKRGKYLVAWLEKASEENEQSSLGITTPVGRVLVRQIAGLVARRIVTDPREGDSVERGQRIGLIRFGSRVDLFLPLDWEVTCTVGDRARVGVTPLARLPSAVEA